MKYATYKRYVERVELIYILGIFIWSGIALFLDEQGYETLSTNLVLIGVVLIFVVGFALEFIFTYLYRRVEDPPPEECCCCKCKREREEEERRQREYQEWMDELAGFPTGAMCGRLRKRHD